MQKQLKETQTNGEPEKVPVKVTKKEINIKKLPKKRMVTEKDLAFMSKLKEVKVQGVAGIKKGKYEVAIEFYMKCVGMIDDYYESNEVLEELNE